MLSQQQGMSTALCGFAAEAVQQQLCSRDITSCQMSYKQSFEVLSSFRKATIANELE